MQLKRADTPVSRSAAAGGHAPNSPTVRLRTPVVGVQDVPCPRMVVTDSSHRQRAFHPPEILITFRLMMGENGAAPHLLLQKHSDLANLLGVVLLDIDLRIDTNDVGRVLRTLQSGINQHVREVDRFLMRHKSVIGHHKEICGVTQI